jgi:hypothetical protein
MAESIKLFLPNREAEYFSRQDWTWMLSGVRLICPSGSFD